MGNGRYANSTNSHINALITGRYRFELRVDALKKIEFFRQNFIEAQLKGQQTPDKSKDFLVMWIRDFYVTEEEEEEGYYGNYAVIRPQKMQSGIYTLSCAKINTDVKHHPRKRRKRERLPNWGHPILRSVKAQRNYPTLESIQSELSQLHLEYPETTIPNENKLLLMIYDRQEKDKEPAQKYILKIIPDKNEEGGYTFEYKLNEHEGRMGPSATSKQDNAAAAAEGPQGYFTSMVALKRKKRPTSATGANSSQSG